MSPYACLHSDYLSRSPWDPHNMLESMMILCSQLTFEVTLDKVIPINLPSITPKIASYGKCCRRNLQYISHKVWISSRFTDHSGHSSLILFAVCRSSQHCHRRARPLYTAFDVTTFLEGISATIGHVWNSHTSTSDASLKKPDREQFERTYKELSSVPSA